MILPLSHQEWSLEKSLEDALTFGCYPQILKSERKQLLLTELYKQYIQKDIVEILKVGNPDIFQTLVTLIGHSSGQLVNFNQLANDCKVSTTMIRNYLDILEQTFVLKKITPFVGNKRTEITHNPIYYFIDNGFRNVALRNFVSSSSRTDQGLLVESFVFQEIYKFKSQNFASFDIHFWRTKSGAEVDFILYKSENHLLPIEVKYQRLSRPILTRGFRSFLQAYRPKEAIIITKDFLGKITESDCQIHFIPLSDLSKIFQIIAQQMLG